jgi:hypothetical protein
MGNAKSPMDFSQGGKLGFVEGPLVIKEQASLRGLILLDLLNRLRGDYFQRAQD